MARAGQGGGSTAVWDAHEQTRGAIQGGRIGGATDMATSAINAGRIGSAADQVAAALAADAERRQAFEQNVFSREQNHQDTHLPGRPRLEVFGV